MSLIKLIDFKQLGDERGSLIALEGNKNIPFDVKRIYYIFDTKKGVSRGFHAHKALQQVALCLKGSCKFVLTDGKTKEEVILNHPTKGLVIGNMMWREIHEFSHDCILLVLANQYYDEQDYIRDYSKFLEIINEVN